jgi:hypothetical protein
MRWFFTIFGTVVGVLFLGFVAWITTRVLHLDGANMWVGRVMVWDLYAIGVVMSYVAFVGTWHLWERLTGRMELGEAARLQAEGQALPRRPDAPEASLAGERERQAP